MASRVLRHLCELSEDNQFIAEIEENMRLYNDLEVLNKLHWSKAKNAYFDYGLHSDKVKLVPVRKLVRKNPNSPPIEEVTYERRAGSPKLQLVDDVFGYVSLFPFLLKLLPPDSPMLEKILVNLNNTNVGCVLLIRIVIWGHPDIT